MIKQIQKIIDHNAQQVKASTLYLVLGKYFDKLPEDVQKDLIEFAENEQEYADKLAAKIKQQ